MLNALPWPRAALGPVARALLTLGFSEFVRTGLYAAYLPAHAGTAGLSLSAVGLAWSLHYLADTLARGLGGYLVARYGLARVALISTLLSTLAVLLAAQTHSLMVLAALAILHGLAVSPLWPGAMSLASSAAKPAEQARAVGFANMSVAPFVGLGFLGMGTFGLAEVRLGGLMLAPALLVTVQALAAGLAAWSLGEPRPPREARRAATRVPWRGLWPTLRFLLPAAFVQTLALTLLGPVIALFARRVGLEGPGLVGVMVVGGAAAYGLLNFTGRLADRRSPRAVLVLGLGLAALSLGLIATLPPLWLYFLLAGVAGFGYACIVPGWGGLVARALPEAQRTVGWGAVMTFENLGTASGPLLGSLAWDHFGLRAPFLLGAGIMLLTALFYARVRPPVAAGD